MASIRDSISLCDPRPLPSVPRREVREGPECFTRKTGGTRFSRVSWEHEGSAEPHSSSPNGSQEVPPIFVRGHRPDLGRATRTENEPSTLFFPKASTLPGVGSMGEIGIISEPTQVLGSIFLICAITNCSRSFWIASIVD